VTILCFFVLYVVEIYTCLAYLSIYPLNKHFNLPPDFSINITAGDKKAANMHDETLTGDEAAATKEIEKD
jgi:hypothetical protein